MLQETFVVLKEQPSLDILVLNDIVLDDEQEVSAYTARLKRENNSIVPKRRTTEHLLSLNNGTRNRIKQFNNENFTKEHDLSEEVPSLNLSRNSETERLRKETN